MSSCHNFFKEALDLGVVIAWRFYGRYPETGRSYYKPPSGNETDRHKNPDRQISTRQAPSLVQSCQLLSSSILALQYHDHFSGCEIAPKESQLLPSSTLYPGTFSELESQKTVLIKMQHCNT
ncbi:hypothetical protein CY35_03G036500 [Sphagnum magellanicum]|nr:hypothetical protein CY35_03G036500 [Sphagnum magellanicum]